MGKLIQFPCRDEYDVWYCEYCEYEEYYENGNEFEDINQDYEVLVKENFISGLVRKCLMFVLVRL